jgi:membrane fusion protein (multidrug efflux system)
MENPERKSKIRLFIIIFISIIVVVVLARSAGNIQKTLFKKKPDAAKKVSGITFEEEALPVKVFKVKKTDFKDTLPCIGNIKGFKEIELKFQVPGIIESINFEEGERIQDGDIIANLVQKDALMKLKYSEIEMNKNQKLLDIGAISPVKMEQSKIEYESARSELEKTNIYAPSGGLLGTRLVDVGSFVTPYDRIGMFVDIDKVYAEFNIIEKDVPKVALGQKAEVFVDAYPNKTFSGVIDRIAPVIEGRSRTENIKVELDNKDNLLKPGMFVRALIATYEKKEDIVVPSSALKKKDNDYIVYVVHKEEPKAETPMKEKAKQKPEKKNMWGFAAKKKEQPDEPKPQSKEKPAEFGTVEIKKIKLGYMTQDLVEVDEGLAEDDLIIVEVQEEFKDKSRVEIGEVQEGLI